MPAFWKWVTLQPKQKRGPGCHLAPFARYSSFTKSFHSGSILLNGCPNVWASLHQIFSGHHGTELYGSIEGEEERLCCPRYLGGVRQVNDNVSRPLALLIDAKVGRLRFQVGEDGLNFLDQKLLNFCSVSVCPQRDMLPFFESVARRGQEIEGDKDSTFVIWLILRVSQ